MHRSIRTRHPGLKMTILGLGLTALLAGACHPEAAPRDEAATGLTVTAQDAGPPALNGEIQPLGVTLDYLRSSGEAATVRLPAGVDRDRLWELFATLEEQLPQERARGMGVELPRPSGEGFKRFPVAPVFLILDAGGDVRFSVAGSGPAPLASAEEVVSLAAGTVAHDPDAPFVLVPEDGAPADLLSRVLEFLRQVQARNFYLMDADGIRPLDPAPEPGEAERDVDR